MGRSTGIRIALGLCCALLAAGCGRDAVRVSAEYLEFGDADTALRFELWNGDAGLDTMEVSIAASVPWISVDPASARCAAPQTVPDKREVLDKKSILVSVDRTMLTGDRAEGAVVISGPRVNPVTIPVYVSPPYEAVALSATALDFGATDVTLTLQAWNVNREAGSLRVAVASSASWLRTNRTVLNSDGPQDRVEIAVTVERERIVQAGTNTARLTFSSPGFADKQVAVTVFKRYNAVGVSVEDMDFGREYLPRILEVWNASDQIPELGVLLQPSDPWIVVTPGSLTSLAPVGGIANRVPVLVSVNRDLLGEGVHQGHIDLLPSRTDVAPKRVTVQVTQDADTPGGGLIITDVQSRYSAPYLLDFTFSLRDRAGNAVIAEPAQFTVSAFENEVPLPSGTQPVLRPGTARQLRCEMVLDYSEPLQNRPRVLAAMEAAASGTFLNALNPEALVGVTAFFRDEEEAVRVADFTTDREYLRERVAAIQSELVAGYATGTRTLDAVYDAVMRFNTADILEEDRRVVLFSSGRDTSSVRSLNEVVNRAAERRVKVMALGFGNIPDFTLLDNLAVRTGGLRLSAQHPEQLEAAFGQIIQNLEGQYVLRWPTLRRDSAAFLPRFTLALGDTFGSHVAAARFTPSAYAGDVRRGTLRLVPSVSGSGASLVLRAEYMPRLIRKIRIYLLSSLPFEARLVDPADSGVLGGWRLTQDPDTDAPGVWLEIESPGDPAAFADFGPLLRLDYPDLPDESTPLLEDLQVDNTLYTGGQYFVVVNFS